MKDDLALKILGELMNWADNEARKEFAWLKFFAKQKFDNYEGYAPGIRFIESLVGWLQQFEPIDRSLAYSFVKERLIYVSRAELSHLVASAFPDHIRPRLIDRVARDLGVDAYEVWAHPDARRCYRDLLRKSLFLGLSDGARIDEFRRLNAGIISNEQVATTVQIDNEKWNDILESLRNDLDDANARFAFVFLIDDFVASGTTFLRFNGSEIKGKLAKFRNSIEVQARDLFEDGWSLVALHYLASHQGEKSLRERLVQAEGVRLPAVDLAFCMTLPESVALTVEAHAFTDCLERYYDKAIETPHTGPNIWLGFNRCGLPIVLEHNTPNNSIALLWARSAGKPGVHAMRPLFPRRQRHVS